MFPYVHTYFGEISMFTIWCVIGIIAMILSIDLQIVSTYKQQERVFIFPRLVFCGGIGFAVAVFTDLIFKYIKYSIFKIYGLTFYGGMLGFFLAVYLLLKYDNSKTRYSRTKWFNILTPSFILFHFFGRIGCFFGGCCYGKVSDSFFALSFPDNPQMGIFHNGLKCYPTQLFEALLLIGIYCLIINTKNKFWVYITSYAVVRFFLEFLRGDDRGYIFGWFSPSQMISLGILMFVLCDCLQWHWKNRRIT